MNLLSNGTTWNYVNDENLINSSVWRNLQIQVELRTNIYWTKALNESEKFLYFKSLKDKDPWPQRERRKLKKEICCEGPSEEFIGGGTEVENIVMTPFAVANVIENDHICLHRENEIVQENIFDFIIYEPHEMEYFRKKFGMIEKVVEIQEVTNVLDIQGVIMEAKTEDLKESGINCNGCVKTLWRPTNLQLLMELMDDGLDQKPRKVKVRNELLLFGSLNREINDSSV
ncbi:MAG: hypothetical protein Ta2E_12310 [Mycoplasmoidaceae bacterium]|nr:MAG: hypothetical protein Ta2E_12310 [Mycoplasmoidaceae bacterium]